MRPITMSARKLMVLLFVCGIFLVAGSRAEAAARPAKTITVLTFNVFDPFFGPDREERMAALPGAIMALDPVPDVMAFEEFFKPRDREQLLAGLKRLGYPVHAARYVHREYGTGMLLVSRYEIESEEYTRFRTAGALYDPQRYAGKGVIHYVLKTDFGPLEFYGSHPIARFRPLYDEQGKHLDTDASTIDRLLEMEQIARVIKEQTSRQARALILAGDLNASPDMWSYQFLLARAGLEDSFYAVHPGRYVSTYSPENTFVKKSDWSRIDHVLFKNLPGSAGLWLRPVTSEVVLKQTIALKHGKQANLSDHFGLLTVFEAMQSQAAVKMSPGFTEAKAEGARSRKDLRGGAILLTPADYPAWQAWAVQAMDRADRSRNRFCQKVIPAARIIIAGKVEEPVRVPLTAMQKLAVEMDLNTSE